MSLIVRLHHLIPSDILSAASGKPGSLRLRGPLSANGTGRVEVLYGGHWGKICSTGWDIEDARVACRQLGYVDAVTALQGSQEFINYGIIWLDKIACTGKENDISSCSHGGWGNHDCMDYSDVGVECSNRGKLTTIIQSFRYFFFAIFFSHLIFANITFYERREFNL